VSNSLHWNNVPEHHLPTRPIGNSNLFGAKLLRELTRTVQTLKPSVFLIDEDYTRLERDDAAGQSGRNWLRCRLVHGLLPQPER
jgi:1,4-alpha-glucan branching enzyme